MNNSGITPLGRAVLVRPYAPEREQAKSLIFIPEHVEDRERTIDTLVEVVEHGPVAWEGEPARATPGDIILIAKFSGTMAKGPKDGKSYRLINDRDVVARFDVEALHG